MQNTANIENIEINISMNQQFGVFSLYNFTKIIIKMKYILVAQENKKRTAKFKKTLNTRFYKKNT